MLKYFLIFALVNVIVYLVCASLQWSFNPAAWHIRAQISAVAMGVVLGLLFAGMATDRLPPIP
jgi:hypothetical protein